MLAKVTRLTDRLLAYEATSLRDLKLPGLGPKSIEKLESAGISCARDLLWFLPRDYLDMTKVIAVNQAEVGQTVLVAGRVLNTRVDRTQRRRIPYFELLLDDGEGTIRAIFYHQVYLAKRIGKGAQLALFGRVEFDRGGRYMANPKQVPAASHPRIVPVYRQVAGLKSERIATWVEAAVARMPDDENLPEEAVAGLGCRRKTAFERLHRPQGRAFAESIKTRQAPAFKRLVVEEFFYFLWGLKRLARSQTAVEVLRPADSDYSEFLAALPFQLTADQATVMGELQSQLPRGERIFALLQGDVGSGKTVVAFYLAFLMARLGRQTALLCPTSVLAAQHARSAERMLGSLGVRSDLLSARQSSQRQAEVLEQLIRGELDLVIGTHRIFQDDVVFQNLALVVADEQHRFGVNQRARLLHKGPRPHYLAMSATPIPRSLALTIYAGYQVHQLREKPPGRTAVKTVLKKTSNRHEVIQFALSRRQADEAIFWVFPLIDGEEEDREKSAVSMSQELAKQFGVDRVGLVHGRMERDQVDALMEQFSQGGLDVLVATTVIEVGVDVPRATVMVIDGADHFGLSQLHQLRGRVGRGERPGFCFLLADEPISRETLERLRVIERTDDGFEIARCDLAKRGFGALMGKTQSGFVTFRLGDPWFDRRCFELAHQWGESAMDESLCQRWFETYPFAG